MPTKRTKPIRLLNGKWITQTWFEATPEEIKADPDGIWYSKSAGAQSAIHVKHMESRHILNCLAIMLSRQKQQCRLAGLDEELAVRLVRLARPVYKRMEQEIENRLNPRPQIETPSRAIELD